MEELSCPSLSGSATMMIAARTVALLTTTMKTATTKTWEVAGSKREAETQSMMKITTTTLLTLTGGSLRQVRTKTMTIKSTPAPATTTLVTTMIAQLTMIMQITQLTEKT